jgi:hypothetical protein
MMQFIPILIILFYGFYETAFVELSKTVLGKIFALTLILYYSKLDKLYGIIACICIILYYRHYENSLESFVSEMFLQNNCVDGQLVHKGIPVKREMAEHIFPELEGTEVSPCINTHYRLKTEEDIKTPKNSRDFMTLIHDTFIDSEEEGFKPLEPWN